MNWKNINWWFVSILIIFIGLIPIWVYLITNYSWIELSENPNNIGDALGGITNPIIGIGGIILTFIAFYVQYQFNKEQSKVILEQKKENNFNFLLSEFTRLEIKIDEASQLGDSFNDVIRDEFGVHKNLLKQKLNKISYAIIYFNNLLKIIDIDRLVKVNELSLIDDKDKIILTNLNSIYSIIFKDSLDNVKSVINYIIEKGFVTDAQYNIIEFQTEFDELQVNLGKIKGILFTHYPPFKTQ